MATSTGTISAGSVLAIGEDSQAANVQSYGITRDVVIAGTTNTVAQIRLDLDDYANNGDEPVIGITLGFTSGTFTVNTGTEVITTSINHERSVGDRFEVSTGGTLPSPLADNITYYVKTVPAANELTVSETDGGSTVNITTAGSGTHSFKSYAGDGGIVVSNDAYMGGVGEPAFPDVTVKDHRSGGIDSWESIKALHVALIPTETDTAASGAIVVSGGDAADPLGHFVFPLRLDAAADSGGSAFGCFALPVGWNYQDTNKLTVEVRDSSNLTVLINIQGH